MQQTFDLNRVKEEILNGYAVKKPYELTIAKLMHFQPMDLVASTSVPCRPSNSSELYLRKNLLQTRFSTLSSQPYLVCSLTGLKEEQQ